MADANDNGTNDAEADMNANGEEILSGEALLTTDHDVIRSWAEDRGGRPTIVRGTRSRDDGLLRIDFVGEKDAVLEEVSWDDFFAIFDANDLVFLYVEDTVDGKQSRYSKFITRETAGLDDEEETVEEQKPDAEEGSQV